MFRNYIIRNDIYPDEIEDNNTFRQQKCVILEKERDALIVLNNEEVKTKVRDLYYFIAYVDSNEKALEIASRFVKEEAQNNDIYKIKWVDQQYSIFD
jgi:hypothetical protein